MIIVSIIIFFNSNFSLLFFLFLLPNYRTAILPMPSSPAYFTIHFCSIRIGITTFFTMFILLALVAKMLFLFISIFSMTWIIFILDPLLIFFFLLRFLQSMVQVLNDFYLLIYRLFSSLQPFLLLFLIVNQVLNKSKYALNIFLALKLFLSYELYVVHQKLSGDGIRVIVKSLWRVFDIK